MKQLREIFGVLIAVLVIGIGAHAQGLTKKWDATYPINGKSSLQIENKFGDIEIKSWNEQQIKVEVTVEVKGKNQDKLQRLLDDITVVDLTKENAVSLRTDFNKNKINNADLSVDYMVFMPNTVPVDLTHAFGNIGLATFEAKVKIDLAYGNLKAGGLMSTSNDINIEFGKAVVDQIKGGKLEVSYSKFVADRLGIIELKSSFSQVEADFIESINVKSEYDGYEIDGIDKLTLKGSFSSFKIDRLNTNLNAKLSYSGFEVDYVDPNFSAVQVESEMGGVELKFAEQASYKFELSSKMGGLKLDKKASVSERVEKETYKKLVGTVGNKPDNRNVKVSVEYGDVDVE